MKQEHNLDLALDEYEIIPFHGGKTDKREPVNLLQDHPNLMMFCPRKGLVPYKYEEIQYLDITFLCTHRSKAPLAFFAQVEGNNSKKLREKTWWNNRYKQTDSISPHILGIGVSNETKITTETIEGVGPRILCFIGKGTKVHSWYKRVLETMHDLASGTIYFANFIKGTSDNIYRTQLFEAFCNIWELPFKEVIEKKGLTHLKTFFPKSDQKVDYSIFDSIFEPQNSKMLLPSAAGLFAGIGGFELGLHRAGFRTKMLCEKDMFAQEIIQKWQKNILEPETNSHPIFKDCSLEDDVCSLKKLPQVTILTAGFPCQDLSLAGSKAGITGERSGLVDEIFRLLHASPDPDWVLLENVPYMLGLHNGKAMSHITKKFEELNYQWAYRELDARSFGIPQRRNRIFFLASKKYDPRHVLFSDIGNTKEPVDDRHKDSPQEDAKAFGFYWTEGERALGWAVDSVPTIKVGSTLGIPSPPAVWNIRRNEKLGPIIGTPVIEDLEALQGFPRKWTEGVSDDRQRWKLIGNAVCPKMSTWIGEKIREVMEQDPSSFPDVGKKFNPSKKWPKAAYREKGKEPQKLDLGSLIDNQPYDLTKTIQNKLKPLSEKAIKGYLERIRKAKKKGKLISDHFLADLTEHWFKMIPGKESHHRYEIPSYDAKSWELYIRDNNAVTCKTTVTTKEIQALLTCWFLTKDSVEEIHVQDQFIYLERNGFQSVGPFSPPYVAMNILCEGVDKKEVLSKIFGIPHGQFAYDKKSKSFCLSLSVVYALIEKSPPKNKDFDHNVYESLHKFFTYSSTNPQSRGATEVQLYMFAKSSPKIAQKLQNIPIGQKESHDDCAVIEQNWLRSQVRPTSPNTKETMVVMDLFSGCGGMSLGIEEALYSHNIGSQHIAVEQDSIPLEVFRSNFQDPKNAFFNQSILDLVQGSVHEPLTEAEKQFQKQFPKVDVLVGGPPCQGHSDLNNHTRRLDPKNELFFTMARCSEIFSPSYVIIENVPGARHDKTQVVQRTEKALRDLGYMYFDQHVFRSDKIGVAQTRKRFIMVASKLPFPELADIENAFEVPNRSLSWAISDLEEIENPKSSYFDIAPNHTPETQARIDWLHDNDKHDLDNSQRPDCHKNKKHSYNSIYGRMHWDKPSQTITGNFGTPGGGRYVHSRQRRLITPHEAARIQFFPDFFDFSGNHSRSQLQKMIGNAVPPKLAYVIMMGLLSSRS